MLPRRLALLLSAITIAGLATTGCAEQSAAAKVGDQTLSESDLMDEVKTLIDNEALWEASGRSVDDLRGEVPSSYNQAFVGQVLQQRVTFMLYEQLLAENDLELNGADVDAGRTQVEEEFGPAFAEFPKSYRDRLAEDLARAIKLQNEVEESELQESYLDLVANVEISSRYGTWDSERFLARDAAIVPPVGPQAAPGAQEDAESLEIPAG